MPISKNQWLRLQLMLGMMRRGEFVNSNRYNREAAESMNCDPVSPKTFNRDIHVLKEDVGAPVEYNARKKGYYLTDPEWTCGDMPAMPGDVKLLLLSEKVSRSFMPPQLRSELTNAVNALLMKQNNAIPEGMELENFQIIAPEFLPRVDPDVFLEVYQAWENKHYLRITYTSSRNHDSVKLVEPVLLAWNSGIWYIKGLVVNEDGTPCSPPFPDRVFALHRIRKAEKTMGRFILDEEESRQFKKNKLFNFETLDEVEIEFFQPYVKVIRERFFSLPESIIAQTEDSITVRLKNIHEHAALQLIFTARGHVRVIKPAGLQDSLRTIAQKIFEYME